MRYLPCKKCGNGLPIVKGSVAQCPYCGAKSLYRESLLSFKYYLTEILNITSFKTKKEINFSELERRKSLIESYFFQIKSDFNEYRHLIITKLDDISIEPLKLFNLIRSTGNFEIIIEEFFNLSICIIYKCLIATNARIHEFVHSWLYKISLFNSDYNVDFTVFIIIEATL